MRGMDPVRVLSELSELVVRKLTDDDGDRAYADPFGRAAMRVLQGREPVVEPGWRRTLAGIDVRGHHAAMVLRRLTRDLLHGITAEPARVEDAPASPLPDNVRPITDALQPAPGFERTTDGKWKPAAPAEEDLLRGHGPRTPRLGSRYPGD